MIPGPRLWCPGGCGNRADDYIGSDTEDAAVLVVLRGEPYWFCGAACASLCLDELYRAIYEKRTTPFFMLLNTISEN